MESIVILTAVETEYEKVREIISQFIDPESSGSEDAIDEGYCYEHIDVVIEGKKYRIVLSTTEQGNSEAATHTTHALIKYNPILIIFAGTCGAIKDANIGDIIIATSVYDFTRGKEKGEFVSKPVSRDISPNMRSISKILMRKVNRGDILKKYFSDEEAKVIQGPIASSQVIVADQNAKTRKVLDSNYADVIGVEMEGYGF
ncbi:hypothetical protein DWC20_05905 [Clostridium botulinum]|uniref:5'-methylthioadenosine/S-adenosylhomocysteine nucleosidase family protein n=1 Tax=Clostridium botulinum TaxID=1491 RepID=UPI00037B0ECF|nr:hypothetical protein [Clostridium botulinum]MBN1035086.1 hypothetical protein [Clostridium botulinum]